MSPLDSSAQARGPHRARPNFLTRAATDDAARLDRRFSLMPPPSSTEPPLIVPLPSHPYEPHTSSSPAAPREHAFTRRVFGKLTGAEARLPGNSFPRDRRKSRSTVAVDPTSFKMQTQDETETKGQNVSAAGTRTGAMPRPVGGQGKLGTFSGVFVPTSLNVLSILMFLRFGLILGQSGFLGMMGACDNISF
jgi:solute carrier family 12 (potassium/chloride transporters), member 9